MRRHGIRSGWVLACLLAVASACFAAERAMGPPFQTDDPDPVDFHHFEAYAFSLSDSTKSGGTALVAPGYEMNWGAVPNVQLHLIAPLTATFPADGSPKQYGYGDTELGAKVRFIKETKTMPEVGIFPFFELPSGNADKGLGVGKTWYRMPLWIQKSWGPWTSYGGGGEAIVPAEGMKNYPFAGLLVQRTLTKKVMLGTELYGHGAITTDSGSSTMLDLGGTYEFKEGFDLLFAGGHSVHGEPETYAYLALYWTWGPKKDEDKKALLARMHLRR